MKLIKDLTTIRQLLACGVEWTVFTVAISKISRRYFSSSFLLLCFTCSYLCCDNNALLHLLISVSKDFVETGSGIPSATVDDAVLITLSAENLALNHQNFPRQHIVLHRKLILHFPNRENPLKFLVLGAFRSRGDLHLSSRTDGSFKRNRVLNHQSEPKFFILALEANSTEFLILSSGVTTVLIKGRAVEPLSYSQ